MTVSYHMKRYRDQDAHNEHFLRIFFPDAAPGECTNPAFLHRIRTPPEPSGRAPIDDGRRAVPVVVAAAAAARAADGGAAVFWFFILYS
jgi:hypothetical protein